MVDDDRTTLGYRWARGLMATAVQLTVYLGIGHTKMPRSTELLRTRFDDLLPFWPWTAWFYMPVYVGIFVAALCGFRSRRLFNHATVAFLLVMVVGALGHIFVRAEYPRPVLLPPYADLSERFLALVQWIDPPGNVFPSLHVAQTSLLAFLLCRDRPVLGRVTVVMGAVLALSTLTTKQHFVADVVSGYLLAFLARAVVLRREGRPDPV